MRERRGGRPRRSLGVLLSLGLVMGCLAAGSPTASGQEAPGLTIPDSGEAEPEELVHLRTKSSRTFLDSEGDFVTEMFTEPIHYKDDGAWAEIDNTLIPSDRPGYAYENAANVYKLLIPEDIAEAPVRIEIGQEWIEFQPEGASGGPAVEGATATFESAIEDVDIFTSLLPRRSRSSFDFRLLRVRMTSSSR